MVLDPSPPPLHVIAEKCRFFASPSRASPISRVHYDSLAIGWFVESALQDTASIWWRHTSLGDLLKKTGKTVGMWGKDECPKRGLGAAWMCRLEYRQYVLLNSWRALTFWTAWRIAILLSVFCALNLTCVQMVVHWNPISKNTLKNAVFKSRSSGARRRRNEQRYGYNGLKMVFRERLCKPRRRRAPNHPLKSLVNQHFTTIWTALFGKEIWQDNKGYRSKKF